MGSVALLYYLIRRVFGVGTGLLAALFLALTPVLVAASRSNIIDSTLVFFMLLGAWAVSRAADTGKLRWLLLCAVLVGLGFNIKMMEAYLVVPAFGLVYLLGSTTSLAHPFPPSRLCRPRDAHHLALLGRGRGSHPGQPASLGRLHQHQLRVGSGHWL